MIIKPSKHLGQVSTAEVPLITMIDDHSLNGTKPLVIAGKSLEHDRSTYKFKIKYIQVHK